ncbi:hypothetical protein [Streptomyces sp. BH104]|uniref:hypothetical protein n=1 Tax=Streptomyces sp. BH104 TaxID=3410407 RepID=UPI003BB6CE3C
MTDPRIRQLAESRYRNGYGVTSEDAWDQLDPALKQHLTSEAGAWLRAAVAAGIVPSAERPTPDHSAVWVDEEGFVYGEYQTSPPTPLADAAILRLVWAGDVCSSKRELEDQGATFRLIGWSE